MELNSVKDAHKTNFAHNMNRKNLDSEKLVMKMSPVTKKRAIKVSKSIGENMPHERSSSFDLNCRSDGAFIKTVPFHKRPLRRSLSEGVIKFCKQSMALILLMSF